MTPGLQHRSPRPEDRRRHARVALGLPVRVHFAGRTLPLTVEMSDVSRGGCFFRGAMAPAGAEVAFGFVVPGRRVCMARGAVVRVERGGFAVRIARANEDFHAFLAGISVGAVSHAA